MIRFVTDCIRKYRKVSDNIFQNIIYIHIYRIDLSVYIQNTENTYTDI